MKVRELVEKYGLTVVAGQGGLDREIRCGYSGDLLSEVMGNAGVGCVWLTVQAHQNIVAVAVLREMAAIVITGGGTPSPETMDKANSENIPVLTYPGNAFDLSGKLYVECQ
ncbi:MAG: DRTGG domain-containing protein [Desulfobacteraceae bacterium]|nr:DRTGG domain-containing protein [Desulfobacteraceae bacterium]